APRDAAADARLAACRRVLFEARGTRVAPARDDKILADWNGLMIWALTEAGLALGEPVWLTAAARALDAVAALLDDRGRLAHVWCGGRRRGGVLADHAATARAALALHAATGENRYLAQARRWADAAADRFWDTEGGGFFVAPADDEALPVRLKTADDEAAPAANGLMAETLARLHLLTGEESYRARAEATVAAFAGAADADLAPLATLLDARALMARPVQVVVAGDPADPAAMALRDAAFRAPVADLVFAFAPPGRDLPATHPAVGKGPVGGRPAAYICLGQTCAPPVVAPERVREALENAGP
ncbi:MAG: thioredoxin domain-containing protein, partial [Kiloniellales bacterium]